MRRRPGVLVALDVPSAADALDLARGLVDQATGFKVGLELLMGPGPGVVAAVRELGRPVFVDAKLHDIPATVERAARRLGRLGARWLTVHASGGDDMVRAAVEGLTSQAPDAGVVAVTVLTSLDEARLARVIGSGSVGRQVARLASLADDAGAEGVVCSVSELGVVAQAAPRLLRVTPGIRPVGSAADDQARVATPSEAVRRGADLVVVGRPVTRASDPAAALRNLVAEMEQAVDTQGNGVGE